MEVTTQNNQIMKKDSAWGVAPGVSTKDITLTRILLMQSISKIVQKGNARAGDLLNKDTGEILGDSNKSIKVIFFAVQKFWEISEVYYEGTKEKEKFSGMELVDEFSELPFDFEDENKPKRRRKTYVFYFCLLKDDGSIHPFPFNIAFRKTSLPTARSLAKVFLEWATEGKPSAAKVIELSSEQQEKNDNLFYVWDYAVGEETSSEQLDRAYKFYCDFEKAKSQYATKATTQTKEEDEVVSSESSTVVSSDHDDEDEVF